MQRGQLFGLDKRELVDEVDEVLEARVQVRLGWKQHDVLKMRVVDVRIHAEQTLEDHLDDSLEVARERNSERARENLLVI